MTINKLFYFFLKIRDFFFSLIIKLNLIILFYWRALIKQNSGGGGAKLKICQ